MPILIFSTPAPQVLSQVYAKPSFELATPSLEPKLQLSAELSNSIKLSAPSLELSLKLCAPSPKLRLETSAPNLEPSFELRAFS